MNDKKTIFNLVALASFACLNPLQAANYYWNTGSGNWTVGANWSDNAISGGTTGTVPLAADSVFFNQSSVNAAETIYLNGNQQADLITFLNTAATAVRGGVAGTPANNVLTLTSGITVNAGAGAVTIGDSAASPTFKVDVVLSGNNTFTNNSSNTLALANNISGSGGLTKSGTGLVTISAANTYSGGTTIKSGTLAGSGNIGAGNSPYGTGAINLGDSTPGNSNNASLGHMNGGGVVTNAINVLAGSSGTLSIAPTSGFMNYSGLVTLNNNLTAGYQAAAGSLTFSGGIVGTGNLTLNSINNVSSNSFTISGGAVNMVGSITNNSANANGVTISAVIGTNVTGVTQNSATSALRLNGVNTYTGATTVSAGTLLVNGSLAAGSAVTVNSTGSLAGSGTINGTTTVSSGGKLGTLNAATSTLTFTTATAGGVNISAAVSPAASGALVFELAASGVNDKFVLSNAAGSLNIGTLDFDDFSFTTLAGFGAGTYTLFDTANALVGSLGTVTGSIGVGYSGTLSMINGNNDLLLTVVAVPEPSTYSLLGLGLAGLFVLRRKARKMC